MQREPSDTITSALRAAEEGKRDELRALLEQLKPSGAAGGRLDERWLAAEWAYVRGDYADAVARFEGFDGDARSGAAPAWQRYLSAHRRAFASLQLGRPSDTEVAIGQGEAILASAPGLASRFSDLTALRGHLQELRGDFEAARAAFELAHAKALERGDFNRAMTAASDLGRVCGILGRPADGMTWLDRAEGYATRAGNDHALRTVRLRRGMLLAAIGELGAALDTYDGLVRDGRRGGPPEFLVDALSRRADVLRSVGRMDEGERDLREAIASAASARLARHELYAHKDMASLLLERASQGDEARASREFAEALELAAALVPPQPLVLMQLAESVLATPALVGRRALAPAPRDRIGAALERARGSGGSGVYQQRERSLAFKRAIGHLSGELSKLIDGKIVLANHVVIPQIGRVLPRAGQARNINPAEIETLRLLIKAPKAGLTITALSADLGQTTQATAKRVMRIRKAIGDDLKVRRVGQERRYSVRLPERSEDGLS